MGDVRIRPNRREVDRALAVAADLAEVRSQSQLTSVVCSLPSLIGAESVALASDVHVASPATGLLALSATTNQPDVYDDHVLHFMRSLWRQQPLVTQQLRGLVDRPTKISDFVSPREWHRREIYHEAYLHMGMEYELSAHIAHDRGRVTCAAFHRACGDDDFGELERELLGMVTPHLRAAHKRVGFLRELQSTIAVLEQTQSRHQVSALLDAGRTRQASAAAATMLTRRQVEVAALLVDGLTVRQIANRLQVALTTVKTHVEHIYQRLGVQNRAQAVAMLLDGHPA